MEVIRNQARTMLAGAMARALLAALAMILVLSASAAGPGAGQPTSASESSGPAYKIEYKFDPQVAVYYTIEDEIRDSGVVPGWLSYSTSVSDRLSIIQTVAAPASRPASTSAPASPASAPAASAPVKSGAIGVSWECDRYEVRERGVKGTEVSFDSLRDLYPPPSLSAAGNVAGSRCTFSIDPVTGRSSDWKTVAGPTEGPPTSRKPSRTLVRCGLGDKALGGLLRDLGPLFMPGAEQRVGGQWRSVQTDTVETFGTVITNVTCTLRAVREVEGRSIASIELAGEMKIVNPTSIATAPKPPASGSASQPDTAAASTRPAARQPASASAATMPTGSGPANQPPATTGRASDRGTEKAGDRRFELATALCVGSVEFDLTRGELVELTLRRELEGATKFESTKSDPLIPTEIRTGTSLVRRVRVSRTAPAKPIIVGGRRPPVVPPDEVETTRPAVKKPTPASPGRQPTTVGSSPASMLRRPPTTQPSPASRPVPTTRPRTPPGQSKPPGISATTQRSPLTTKPGRTGRPLAPPAGATTQPSKGAVPRDGATTQGAARPLGRAQPDPPTQ